MKRIKKTIAVMLAFGMLASGVGTGDEQAAEAKAAKKPSIAKKATVMEGQEKSLSIKASGIKIKSISVKSSDKSVLKVKAKKKTKRVILTGVSNGTAKVTTTIKALKKKKTMKYKLTTTVTVESLEMAGYENIDVDYDVDTGEVIMNASVNMGLALIDMFVPGGKVISKGLGSVYSDLQKGSKKSDGSNNTEEIKKQLDSISKDISSLREEIDTQFTSLKGQIDKGFEDLESKIVNQTITSSVGEQLDKLRTSLEETASQIDEIMSDDDINEASKAVYIADLIGNNSDWTKSDNLVFLFKHFMNSLSTATFKNQDADTDLFDVAFKQAYNNMKNEIMFSTEAKPLSDKYIQKVMLLGLNAYSVISICLKAHQLVSTIKPEDVDDETAKARLGTTKSRANSVNKEIERITEKMFDAEKSYSVTYHLNKYLNMSPVFTDKGKISKTYKKQLKTVTVNKGETQKWYYDTCVDLMKGAGFDFNTGGDFGFGTLAGGMDLIVYVLEKDMSLKDYLSEVGFDTSGIDDDTFFAFHIDAKETDDGVFDKVYANGFYCRKRKQFEYIDYNEFRYDNGDYVIKLCPAENETKLCFFELES